MSSPAGVARDVGESERRADLGSTIIENVIAVALLAIVVVPVLGGVVSVTRASSVARASSNVETALINAVDRVNRADAASNQICDYYQYARAAVVTQGWSGSDVTVVNEHLDLTTDAWVQGGCPSGVYVHGLVQRVTITVSDPDDRVSRTIRVVKSEI